MYCDDPNIDKSGAVEDMDASVLFPDVSGFTKLSETLAKEGQFGAEKLSTVLNDYFRLMIEHIHTHGGDILKFAGDAVQVMFSDLDDHVARTCYCALLLVSKLDNHTSSTGDVLRLKASVGTGRLYGMHIGGPGGRWEYCIAGDPVTQITTAEAKAEPGMVVVSKETWNKIAGRFSGVALDDNDGVMLVTEMVDTPNPLPPNSVVDWSAPDFSPENMQKFVNCLEAYTSSAFVDRMYRKAMSKDGGSWATKYRSVQNVNDTKTETVTRLDNVLTETAELRKATILFMNLPDLDLVTAGINRVQQIVKTMLRTLADKEGTLRQFIVDDKGCVMIGIFGLPPYVHADDALRGVTAALDIREALSELSVRCSIGVTLGEALVGGVGCGTRCEYALMNDVVNLAARLMSKARDEVLVSGAVHDAIAGKVKTTPLAPMKVKGKSEPVDVHRAVGLEKAPAKTNQGFVGRVDEKKIAGEFCEAWVNGSHSILMSIFGGGGVGKSRFMEEVISRYCSSCQRVAGSANISEQHTPYFVFRSVFTQLFLVTIESSEERAQSRRREDGGGEVGESTLVMSNVFKRRKQNGGMEKPKTDMTKVVLEDQNRTELQNFFPLLSSILSLDQTENEFTRSMPPKARADTLRRILLQLIKDGVSRFKRLVISLDDAQYMDINSARLVTLVLENISCIAVIVTARESALGIILGDDPSAAQKAGGYSVREVHLDNFSQDDAHQFACVCLSVFQVPDAIAGYIFDKAKGNALYTKEFATAVVNAKLLNVNNFVCRLNESVLTQKKGAAGGLGEVEESQAERIDMFMQKVIGDVSCDSLVMSRINELEKRAPKLVDALQVASVIGIEVPSALWYDVMKSVEVGDNGAILNEVLLSPQYKGITWGDYIHLEGARNSESLPVFIFHNVFVQRGLYSMMLPSRRSEIHATVAKWYESEYRDSEELKLHLAQLIHHYQGAENNEKALQYLNQAANIALQGNRNEDAVKWLTSALDMQPPENVWQKNHILFQLAVAHYRIQDMSHAEFYNQSALACISGEVNVHLPEDIGKSQLQREMFKFFFMPDSCKPKPRVTRSVARQTSSCFELMFKINSALNKETKATWCALRCMEWARLIDQDVSASSRELISAHRNLAVVLARLQTPKYFARAEAYCSRALMYAEEANDMRSKTHTQQDLATLMLSTGRWQHATDYYEQASRNGETVGDWKAVDECLTMRAFLHFVGGRMSECAENCERALSTESARPVPPDVRQQAEMFLVQALMMLLCAETDEMVKVLEEKIRLFEQLWGWRQKALTAFLAVCLMRGGVTKHVAAGAEARQAENALEKEGAYSVLAFYVYTSVADVHLSLWEHNKSSEAHRANALKAMKRMQAYGQMFPFTQSRQLLVMGRRRFIEGKSSEAVSVWKKSLSAAAKMKMPTEEVMVLTNLVAAGETSYGARLAELRSTLGVRDPAAPPPSSSSTAAPTPATAAVSSVSQASS